MERNEVLDMIQKLREMRLPVMAEELEKQFEDPYYENYSFMERFQMILNNEYDSRVNHTVQRYVQQAKFYDSTANLKDINYKPERKLNKGLIDELGTNYYIEKGLNVILVGASGSGKTWLACALGMNACKARYRVQYIRMIDLLSEIESKKRKDTYEHYMKRIAKLDLLIIDEFLLTKINEIELTDLYNIIETRTNRKSTIFCSQWDPKGWFEKLGNGPLADSVMDRVINSSYKIMFEGRSLREEYSQINQ